MENFRHPRNGSTLNANNNPIGWKKAPNPFFCFLQDFRQQHSTSYGGKRLKVSELSQAAGEKWRQMSEDEKLLYKVWAFKNRETARHLNSSYFT